MSEKQTIFHFKHYLQKTPRLEFYDKLEMGRTLYRKHGKMIKPIGQQGPVATNWHLSHPPPSLSTRYNLLFLHTPYPKLSLNVVSACFINPSPCYKWQKYLAPLFMF